MVRQEQLTQHVLRNVEMFRAKQRKISAFDDEQTKKHQYRELKEILSPFWTMRTVTR